MSLPEESPVLSESPEVPRRLGQIAIAGAIYLMLLGVGLALGGELGQFAGAGLNALPFAVLAVLAYLGEGRFNWAQLAAGVWLAILANAAGLLALGTTVIAINGGTSVPFNSEQILQLALVSLGVLLALGLGVLCLLPPVRRATARILPIDPDSFIHAIALACVTAVTLICFMPLIVLGEPPFLAAIDIFLEDSGAGVRDSAGQLRDQIYGLIWTIPATILAVGYGIRRNLGQALGRLGLVRPSWRQVLAGIAIALALALAVQLLGAGIDWLWHSLGWPTTDQDAFDDLIAFAFTPIGAVVLGLTAGLGEELSVRGVLQPRLGLIISDLFFTALHALQYNWDALIVVFVVGLVCGMVRNRTNTSTAAIVHGTYNFALIILSLVFGV